jgi:hypothetical protein
VDDDGGGRREVDENLGCRWGILGWHFDEAETSDFVDSGTQGLKLGLDRLNLAGHNHTTFSGWFADDSTRVYAPRSER